MTTAIKETAQTSILVMFVENTGVACHFETINDAVETRSLSEFSLVSFSNDVIPSPWSYSW